MLALPIMTFLSLWTGPLNCISNQSDLSSLELPLSGHYITAAIKVNKTTSKNTWRLVERSMSSVLCPRLERQPGKAVVQRELQVYSLSVLAGSEPSQGLIIAFCLSLGISWLGKQACVVIFPDNCQLPTS